MANKQLVPSQTEMRRYLSRGLTQQQVADQYLEDTGIKVSRAAIAMAIQRYGLSSNKTRPRYEDTLPWKIRSEHQNDHNARMLRLEARLRRGDGLSEEEGRWLAGWKANLKHRDAVVTYHPDLGFQWVQRNQWDEDLIRFNPVNKPAGKRQASEAV